MIRRTSAPPTASGSGEPQEDPAARAAEPFEPCGKASPEPIATALPRHYAGLAPNIVGGAWILVSALTFASMMTLVKFLGGHYPAAVQSAYRQFASLTVMSPFILRERRRVFATPRPALLVSTMALSTLGLVLGMYSYQALPFATANALSFSRTLWMVPLAALILRERGGFARLTAALVGFAGVLFMLRTGGDLRLDEGTAAALVASLVTAAVIVCMKVLLADHGIWQIMAWSATVGLAFSLVPAVLVWRWPGPTDFALLFAMGMLGIATQASYLRGVSIGDAAAVVPVDYSRLLFAVSFGWLLFGEIPSSATLIGGGIVIAATLFLGWHEALRHRIASSAGAGVD